MNDAIQMNYYKGKPTQDDRLHSKTNAHFKQNYQTKIAIYYRLLILLRMRKSINKRACFVYRRKHYLLGTAKVVTQIWSKSRQNGSGPRSVQRGFRYGRHYYELFHSLVLKCFRHKKSTSNTEICTSFNL